MKMILLSTVAAVALSSSAFAEDFKWSGPYAGVNAGYIWGTATTRDDDKDWGNDPKFVGPFDNSAAGFVGGGTLGYNLQLDRVILGVEADLDYADLSGDIATASSQSGNHQNISLDSGFLGAVNGRIGFLIDPAMMIYAKGGLAVYTGEASQATTADGYQSHGTNAFTGWTVGGGVERMMTQNISLKIEYAHYDFGNQDGDQTNVGDVSSPPGYKFHNHTDLTADSVKFGIAYHF